MLCDGCHCRPQRIHSSVCYSLGARQRSFLADLSKAIFAWQNYACAEIEFSRPQKNEKPLYSYQLLSLPKKYTYAPARQFCQIQFFFFHFFSTISIIIIHSPNFCTYCTLRYLFLQMNVGNDIFLRKQQLYEDGVPRYSIHSI